MTMVCCDTEMTRTARSAPTLAAMAKLAAGSLASHMNGLARSYADRRRMKRDAAALAAMPDDLRKDLGWPAGDMHR